MYKSSPLKHNEVADEKLHKTLTKEEHDELHGDTSVWDADAQNKLEESDRKGAENIVENTDIDFLQEDYDNNQTINAKDLTHGESLFEDKETNYIENLKKTPFIQSLIKNSNKKPEEVIQRIDVSGPNDEILITNEFGLKVTLRNFGPQKRTDDESPFLTKLNDFAKKTREARLFLAKSKKEETASIKDKTTPVERNGKEITWEEATKDPALYNTLTKGEKLRLADQATITSFQKDLLNIQNTNSTLKEESEQNQIIKPPSPIVEEEKHWEVDAKVKEQDPDFIHVDVTSSDGDGYNSRKNYIQQRKVENEELVLKKLSVEENKKPGEFFTTKEEWLEYKREQASESVQDAFKFSEEDLEKQWDAYINKREESDPQLILAKNKAKEDDFIVDEILSSEDNDDFRSYFFNLGEDEYMAFPTLEEDIKEAILNNATDKQRRKALTRAELTSGLSGDEKLEIINLAKADVLTKKLSESNTLDENFIQQEADYNNNLNEYKREYDEIQEAIAINDKAIAEGGWVDKVNNQNEEQEKLEQEWKSLENDFAKLGDVDENSSNEDILAYNELYRKWQKLKVKSDGFENNSLAKNETYQELIKKGQALNSRIDQLNNKKAMLDNQQEVLNGFINKHNKYKQTIVSELGYNVMNQAFDTSFKRTD